MNKSTDHLDSSGGHTIHIAKRADGKYVATTENQALASREWVADSEGDAYLAAKNDLHFAGLRGDL